MNECMDNRAEILRLHAVNAAMQAELEQITAELKQVTAERNAAVADLRQMSVFGNSCAFCLKNRSVCELRGPGRRTVEPCWQWRGLREESEGMNTLQSSQADTYGGRGAHGKVKNVLKGLLRQYKLEEINIISPEKVIYSGSPDGWTATDVDMILYKRAVENLEVTDKMLFNNRKVFLFVPEPEV